MFISDRKIEELEGKLGYIFKNKALLYEALTHPSNNKHSKEKKNYERLEFLGNSVLGLVIAGAIYELFPEVDEGKMSIMLSKMTSTSGIVSAMEDLEIGNYISMDFGEEKNFGRNNPRNLENCVEAIIGAIFVDGGYYKAEIVVRKFWLQKIESSSGLQLRDAKSRLQEVCQKINNKIPLYQLESQSGPKHDLTFIVSCRISINDNDDDKITKGAGKTKKEAEQNAASEMLNNLLPSIL